jgi:hypothetical protein
MDFIGRSLLGLEKQVCWCKADAKAASVGAGSSARQRDEYFRSPAGFGHGGVVHIERDRSRASFGIGIALGGGEPQPFVGLDSEFHGIGPDQVQAVPVLSHSEFVLRAGISALGSPRHPHHGTLLVASHALTLQVHDAKVELRQPMILLGSLAVPLSGGNEIALGSGLGAAHTHNELSFGIAGVGKFSRGL